MAKQTDIQRQLQTLRQSVERAGVEGLLLQEIEQQEGLTLDRRVLQRRLKRLVQTGQLKTAGRGRATRYLPMALPPTSSASPEVAAPRQQVPPEEIPRSPPADRLIGLLSRPLTARAPIGYQRRFLDSYQPNSTRYLSPTESRHLMEISRTTTSTAEPAGTYAQKILHRLLIDLSWNSSRLEGNTYSLLDTERLMSAGEAAEGKAAHETQMILNHKAAIEFLVDGAADIAFDRMTILNLHALLAENLLPDPLAAGRLRSIPVSIGQSVYHPLEVPQLIEEAFDQILRVASLIDDPFEQALFAMIQLPYLQPFEDVNKRVSRLAANIPLIKRNLSPLSYVDVPVDLYTKGILAVYELQRIELAKDVFIWAYERSAARYAAIRQSIGEPDAFRLRHRLALREVVAAIIKARMDKRNAARHVSAFAAERIDDADRARFSETAEAELLGLHEGNFARYQVRPSEFRDWFKVWSAPVRRKGR